MCVSHTHREQRGNHHNPLKSLQDDMMRDTLSHLSKQAIELIRQAREQGRHEARKDMEQMFAQWYKDADQLVMYLGAITQGIQNLQCAMSKQFPGIGHAGEGARRKTMLTTQEEPRPFDRPASMNRQSSVESCPNIAKEETAGRYVARESTGTEPSSPTSCTLDDSVFSATTSQGTPAPVEKHDAADEQRERPQPNDIASPAQGRYLPSSDEECKCRGNGVELHPRKLLASQKQKDKI